MDRTYSSRVGVVLGDQSFAESKNTVPYPGQGIGELLKKARLGLEVLCIFFPAVVHGSGIDPASDGGDRPGHTRLADRMMHSPIRAAHGPLPTNATATYHVKDDLSCRKKNRQPNLLSVKSLNQK
jgi:hypothetical protein